MLCFDRRFTGLRILGANIVKRDNDDKSIAVKWISKYSNGVFEFKQDKYFLVPRSLQSYKYIEEGAVVAHTKLFTSKEINYMSKKISKKLHELIRR